MIFNRATSDYTRQTQQNGKTNYPKADSPSHEIISIEMLGHMLVLKPN
jgi:hypothetical protein